MIWTQKLLFSAVLLALSSNVGLAQTDVTGKWEARLKVLPEYGGGTFDSEWELVQSGTDVSGRITEVVSGKQSEFSDGYHDDTGVLGFGFHAHVQGKKVTIAVEVQVKDGAFEGTYEIVTGKAEAGKLEVVHVSKGKLTGRKVAGPQKSKTKKAGGKNQGENLNDAGGQNPAQGSGETEVLFDGTSLDNFRGYKKEKIGKGWNVENGTLHFDGTRSGDLITKKQYGSFELTFDWKVSEGGNSGVMYRVTLGDSAASKSGIEYQILDNDKHRDGKKRETCAGSIYALYQPGDALPKTPGQWNSSKIVIDGDNVQHWLNGEKVVDAEIDSEDWQQRISKSKFAKWKKFGKSKRGHIAFQDHKDPVWYRNIRIKAMD